MSAKKTIDKLGAAAVYSAAVARLGGDRKPLERLGLVAETLGDANRIMVEAFAKLSPTERKADFASLRHGRGGRPLIGASRKKRYQIMLDEAVAERLRTLGEGNLSAGIARAEEMARG